MIEELVLTSAFNFTPANLTLFCELFFQARFSRYKTM